MYIISFIIFFYLGWKLKEVHNMFKLLSMKKYVKEIIEYEKKLELKEELKNKKLKKELEDL